jgi:hypothetical protein
MIVAFKNFNSFSNNDQFVGFGRKDDWNFYTHFKTDRSKNNYGEFYLK